jgi:hypothetical protein
MLRGRPRGSVPLLAAILDDGVRWQSALEIVINIP